MFLIEIFLPTYDNEGKPFAKGFFDAVRQELADQFGGVTAFLRAPASGLWEDETGELHRDDMAIFEVMTEEVDRGWWRSYQQKLEKTFRQKEIVVRATACERL